MTPKDVQGWLDRYLAAWRSNDPGEIEELFSVDATYAYHPWDEPVQGRSQIVAGWLERKDVPDTWRATFVVDVVESDSAVAFGETHYDGGLSYRNLWQLSFDAQGRCTSFVEWYMTPRT